MDLNLDALADAIIEEYKRRTDDEKFVNAFIAEVGAKGTYSDVYKLAKKAGLNLEQAIINQWTFGEGEVFFETIKRLLSKVSGPMHADIASACEYIQSNMNKASKLNLKALSAPVNDYDLGVIADRMKNKGITQIAGELQTLGCKMVDANVQANMDLATSAGYDIVVTRRYDSIGLRRNTKYAERCAFCVALEGTHTFKSTREARSSGVFSRHAGCGCVIDYYSKRTGKTDRNIQNFHKAKATPEELESYEELKREKHRAANAKRSATMKRKWASRKEEVEHNLEMVRRSQEFYGSPKGREVMENLKSQKNIGEVNEQSNKINKRKEASTRVNFDYINSNEYRVKLDEITESTTERRAIEQSIKSMMPHRDGTHFEDLAFIDSKTGKVIINKGYDYYDEKNGISACEPNKPMKRMLKKSEHFSIISVHNHPSNNPPSIVDVNEIAKRKQKYGIVACHNGTIYKYKLQNYKKSINVQFALDDLGDAVYHNDNEGKVKAIKDLANYGVFVEVM